MNLTFLTSRSARRAAVAAGAAALALTAAPPASADPVPTWVTLTAAVNPTTARQPYRLVATVHWATGPGTVAFEVDDAPVAGCAAVPVVAEVASCTVTPVSTGVERTRATFHPVAGGRSPSSEHSQIVTTRPCGGTFVGCNLAALDLQGAFFKRRDLTGADLRHARLDGATFDMTGLRGVNLAAASLTGAQFSDANLTGADLRHAQLDGLRAHKTSIGGANLAATDLIGAHFHEATLDRSDLRHSRLTGAHLESVWLGHANLAGADLEGVDFIDADLGGADLRGTRRISVEWVRSVCPDRTNSADHGDTCEGHLRPVP